VVEEVVVERRVPLWAKLLLFPVAAVWVLRWKLAVIVGVWWTVGWLSGRAF